MATADSGKAPPMPSMPTMGTLDGYNVVYPPINSPYVHLFQSHHKKEGIKLPQNPDLSTSIQIADYRDIVAFPTEPYLNWLDWLQEDVQEAYTQSLGFNEYCVVGPDGEIDHTKPTRRFIDYQGGKLSPYTKSIKNSKISSHCTNRLLSLREGHKLKLIKTELTLPDDELKELILEDPYEFEKRAWRMFGKFIRALKYQYGHVPIQANFHPWSTKEPNTPHPHFHIDIIWGVPTSREGSMPWRSILALPCTFVPDEEYLTPLPEASRGKPIDRDELLLLWSKYVEKEFSCTPQNMFISWLNLGDKARVMHRTKYRKRHPVLDVMEYFRQHSFNDADWDFNWANYILHYDNRSRAFGTWTRLGDFEDKDLAVIRSNTIPCPITGEPLIKKGFVPYREDLPFVFVTRNGSCYWHGPGPPPPIIREVF